jgi:hypothetical protein
MRNWKNTEFFVYKAFHKLDFPLASAAAEENNAVFGDSDYFASTSAGDQGVKSSNH